MKRTVALLLALLLIALPALAEQVFTPFDYVPGQSGGGMYLSFACPDIRLLLPIDWQGRFVVKKSESGLAFYQLASYDKYEEAGLPGGGFLFQLCASEDESYEDLPAYSYVGYSENAGLHFYLMLPSDYPAYVEDEAVRAEYDEMAGDIPDIVELARIAPNMEFYTEGVEYTDAGMS